MKRIRLSPELELPPEAVTETFGLLAVRGAGKTNAARVMAEGFFSAGLPFVAVDPVGSWRGLRSSRDGRGPGLPIPIFGGRAGDVPLERGSGQLLADLVVDQRLSCVLDLTRLESEAAKKGFLLDFARQLYQRNELPLHLFLEEADDYIPQRPMRDEALLLRAWENIVRRGRARGLGCTLITQRSAAIAKDVLTQVQTLITMRTTGPQDVAAIAAWLKYHAQGLEILKTLASLSSGEAWVWSPVFLGKTVRIRFDLSRTFDSGATPKADSKAPAAATLADVDLGEIKVRMAATIERARAEDPRELRRRIADLEAQLRTAAKAPPPAKPPKRVEVPILRDSDTRRIAATAKLVDRRAETLGLATLAITEAAKVLREQTAALEQLVRTAAAAAAPPPAPAPSPAPRPLEARRPSAPAELPAGARRMVEALADRPRGLNARQLGLRARMSSKSGSFDVYVAQARAAGLLDGSRDLYRITPAGQALVASRPPAPTGTALRDYWLGQLPAGAARMLEALVAVYPSGLGKAQLAEAATMSASSGSFDIYLGKLRTLELVEGKPEVKASAELFE